MEIPFNAKKCSHCGTDQRNWFRRHPILTGILVLFILGAILSALGGKSSESSKSTATVADKSNTNAQVTSAPLVVDATALVGEYDKNKLSAQDKYTGKDVQTTAIIENISTDIMGSYYLSLKPSNDPYYVGTTIQCYFNDKSQLTSLSKGQSVTIHGTMQDMSLGIVGMKECGIVK